MAKKAKKAKKTKAKAKSAKKTKSRTAKKAARSALKIIKVIAIENRQPLGPASFYAIATVQVPSPGYTATLTKAVPQGIIATILLLKVTTKKKPGFWPPVVTNVDARYDIKNYKGKYKQVTVLYGKESKTAKVQIVV
jgi:hypothetical protein